MLGDEENEAEACPYALDSLKNETDLKRMIDTLTRDPIVREHLVLGTHWRAHQDTLICWKRAAIHIKAMGTSDSNS